MPDRNEWLPRLPRGSIAGHGSLHALQPFTNSRAAACEKFNRLGLIQTAPRPRFRQNMPVDGPGTPRRMVGQVGQGRVRLAALVHLSPRLPGLTTRLNSRLPMLSAPLEFLNRRLTFDPLLLGYLTPARLRLRLHPPASARTPHRSSHAQRPAPHASRPSRRGSGIHRPALCPCSHG